MFLKELKPPQLSRRHDKVKGSEAPQTEDISCYWLNVWET